MSESMDVSEQTPLKQKEKNEGDQPRGSFSTKLGTIFSLLGCAVGTGNIWRFPRICAKNAQHGGSLAFLLVWILFLFIWSIPMLIIEYALGRYTKKGVIQSFMDIGGPKSTWCGVWIVMTQLLIGAYYVVIVGWCLYYLIHAIAFPLPDTYEASLQVFNNFAQDGYWPILTQVIVIVFSCLVLLKGVSAIEKANLALVPLLLATLGFIFIWSLTRSHAIDGIKYMFNFNGRDLANPELWVDAASQNAFDTGGGSGVFVAYSGYMGRKNSIIKYATGVPVGNNFVSLMSGMMIYSTVFSSVLTKAPNSTTADILEILNYAGPGGTGLAFIWIPVLTGQMGNMGTAICILLFFSMLCAGLSSVLAYFEAVVLPLCDMGMPRKYAVMLSSLLLFVIGLGSAISLKFLENQDFVWGFALLVNGLMLQAHVIYYGASLFRNELINNYSLNDWYLPRPWEWHIRFIAPLLAVLLLGWWSINSIVFGDRSWDILNPTSFISVILQWTTLLCVSTIYTAISINRSKTKTSKVEDSKDQSVDKQPEEQPVIETTDSQIDHAAIEQVEEKETK